MDGDTFRMVYFVLSLMNLGISIIYIIQKGV